MGDKLPVKESISKSEYLQLVGLKVLADKYEKLLKEIMLAAKEIIGDENDYSHVDDWTYGSRETDEMLKLMNVKVRKNGKSLRHHKRSR